MNKFFFFLLIGGSLFITGCETTREISLNKDSSGTLTTTTDMSSLIGMAKMSGQNKELDKLSDKAIDTTLSLDKMADSLEGASDLEKAMVKKGKVGVVLNMAEDKMIVKFELPFSDPSQINRLEKLSSKLMQQTMKKQLSGMGDDDVFAAIPGAGKSESSIEDYFVTTYSKGIIEKKLNNEKYATAETDEGLKALKEMSGMGIGNSTLIINLPKPAKKAEGKNVKLSDDKKKVIITSNAEDFFDDATSLEFRIEY